MEQETGESSSIYHGPSRIGATYNKSVVGEPIVHKCTLDKFPVGTVIVIVNAIESEMYDLLALPEKDTSPLLRRALNYLHKYWKQLFAYRNDGEYTIDNMATERAIRPMTVQQKNSLFFGSTKGAIRLAIYNTFIETCK